MTFVINNEGYAVERALGENPDWRYNDLAPWDYHKLRAALDGVWCFLASSRTSNQTHLKLTFLSLSKKGT